MKELFFFFSPLLYFHLDLKKKYCILHNYGLVSDVIYKELP